MDTRLITMNSQLVAASRWTTEAERSRNQLQDIQERLQELMEARDEELARFERSAKASLQTELQKIEEAVDGQLETVRLDCRTRAESLGQSRDQALRQLSNEVTEDVARLQERRKSETWMLQSVLDEDTGDSPAALFDRETETFVTQKAFLDERFKQLQQQLQRTRQYLVSCHAAAESVLPEPTLTHTSRVELCDAAVEGSDAALSQAGQLEQLHLSQWVKGLRIWGFSFILFVLLWVPITALRADLRQFVNPDIGNPDWQWAAVSSLISVATVLLSSLVLLMTVQSRLRHQFQLVQEHVSNADYGRRKWVEKSQKHIGHLEQTAEKWRRETEERRVTQTRKIHEEIDSRLERIQLRATDERRCLDDRLQAATADLETNRAALESTIESRRQNNLREAQEQFAADTQSASQATRKRFGQAITDQKEAATQVLGLWKQCVTSLRTLSQASRGMAAGTLSWPRSNGLGWSLPETMPECISQGDILVTAPKAPETIESVEATNLCLEMPALLRFPRDTSILVEHDSAGREVALSFLRRQMLKLLTVIPAGRIRLTLIDPVGLGQSFSAMMHLADFDELLIHSRIWTDSSQIRDQLMKVTVHMENIFQTYLRSEFDTIEDYNASAGEVAEPYHFVVVAGFPSAFTDESARHLSSILTSGPRCGVHALVAWNPAVSPPPAFDTEDLTNHSTRFHIVGDMVQPKQEFSKAVLYEPSSEPESEDYVKLVRAVGEQSRDARRVEVSFTRIAPRDDAIWSHSTADGIDLPIGRAGAARLQFLRLGRGTSQHVLIAGKTGSGKSTLLHILITNLAMHYSPNEIQFYLVDFKKGVEFRTYAANRLPHARVVAIESDREFGLSVLERLDEILQERGDLFRERGVQGVPAFREQFPAEPMPRLLLLVDEFQEFFVAEDRVSARASLLLDRLVRQGRAFGIHVLLGSQTLGGAYSLARSTMGQIAVRIALQCSENDAHLILSEDNSAARLLARPGEAIYNDANGLVQGNHQFQIAWLDEARREDAIGTMLGASRTVDRGEHGMVVFEGNVPPTADLCGPMNAYLSNSQDATRRSAEAVTVWLGEPVAIAAPTCVELRRASGQNLLMIGQDENQIDSLLAFAALSFCCGPKPHQQIDDTITSRFVLLQDGRNEESADRFRNFKRYFQTDAPELKMESDCDAVIDEIHAEVVEREKNSERSGGGEIFLVVRNVGQFRSLRKDEDDFGMGGFGEPKPLTVANKFSELLKRGPVVGVHVIVWSDTFSNAVRWLSNSLLREFEHRIAFRMNQTDSASLVDTPVASTLGPGRAIVYRDQTGTTEKFRPFAWPSDDWLQSIINPEDSTAEPEPDINSFTIE
ncbi:MAG: FtsK/SpoIIIE domain-containing protein [Fuerstiella sp.]|nr:FtsK/SpoIIIE domain-containing protein [Fuerstiella sp.]